MVQGPGFLWSLLPSASAYPVRSFGEALEVLKMALCIYFAHRAIRLASAASNADFPELTAGQGDIHPLNSG